MFCQLCWHKEMLDCCTIHHLGVFIKEKIHWGSRERETGQQRDRNKASVPVCECVHGGYASAFFEHPQGVKVGEVFLRAGQSDR